MTRAVTVLAPGPLCTVQDAGRPGLAALGVGRSGACDRAAYALANRLVGNPAGAAALEVTFGGLRLRADHDVVLASAGARCPGDRAYGGPVHLRAGEELVLGAPAAGLRTCVALRGGVDVPAVLASRSTDLLAGLGPAPLQAGDRLALGEPAAPMPGVDLAPTAEPAAGDVAVRVTDGPRADWFTPDALVALLAGRWTVTPESNRVGLRLDGTPLQRSGPGELPSEGMVRGALQVPPSGLPVLFLADHPVTGGYPVVAYVDDRDVDRCAQLRPGQGLRLTRSA